MFLAVRRALAAVRDDHLTIAVATGTHGPARLDRLGLPEDLLRRHRVVNHDARDESVMVEMGRTSRGTRLRVNRCLAEADLIVATGRVKPHPVAGWGGGAKAIVPGLAHHEDVAAEPRARRRSGLHARRRRRQPLPRGPRGGGAAARPRHLDGERGRGPRRGHRGGRGRPRLRAPRGRPHGATGVRGAGGGRPTASSPPRRSRSPRACARPRSSSRRPGSSCARAGPRSWSPSAPDGVGPLAVDEEVLGRARRYLPEGSELVVVSGLDEATVRARGRDVRPDGRGGARAGARAGREADARRARVARRGGPRAAREVS